MSELYSDRISEIQINKYYANAKDSIRGLQINQIEFSDKVSGYDAKMSRLAADKESYKKENKRDIGSAESPERERTKAQRNERLAVLLEDTIARRFDLDDWLETLEIDETGESMTEVTLAAEYDDIENGADIIGIARGPEFGSKPGVFAIDVTYGHKRDGVRSKMNRMHREVLDGGALPRFTRFDFARTEYEIDGEDPMPVELDNVPRFVVAIEVDNEDFFSILRKYHGDTASPYYNADQVRDAAAAPLERTQFKVVSELAKQARANYEWLQRQIADDDGSRQSRTERLQASLQNIEPLVGYFEDAFSRVKKKYPHLNESGLKSSDGVYESVMDNAENIRETDDDRYIERLRKHGRSVGSAFDSTRKTKP